MRQPKNFHSANAPAAGNTRALLLPKAHGPEKRTPAAERSMQRRAAQSGDGWSQLSSQKLVLVERRFFTVSLQALVTRDDRCFDIPVAVQHVAQHILQTRERRFTGNVIIAANFLLNDQIEGPAHRFRSVMERRL